MEIIKMIQHAAAVFFSVLFGSTLGIVCLLMFFLGIILITVGYMVFSCAEKRFAGAASNLTSTSFDYEGWFFHRLKVANAIGGVGLVMFIISAILFIYIFE